MAVTSADSAGKSARRTHLPNKTRVRLELRGGERLFGKHSSATRSPAKLTRERESPAEPCSGESCLLQSLHHKPLRTVRLSSAPANTPAIRGDLSKFAERTQEEHHCVRCVFARRMQNRVRICRSRFERIDFRKGNAN